MVASGGMGLFGSGPGLVWIPMACCMNVSKSPTVLVALTWKFFVVRSEPPMLPVKPSVPWSGKIAS